MQIIAHRKNTIDDLVETPKEFGIEVDIRSTSTELIINHDPLSKGISFKEWLKYFDHQTLILNVKEEGLEDPLLTLMAEFNIQNYFFLDQSFPFLVKSYKRGIRNCAVRVSEYESIETVLNLKGNIDWVWLDCFNGVPLPSKIIAICQEAGFKVCLVSPELQGYKTGNIEKFKTEYQQSNIQIDAVCTKFPYLWK